MSYEQQRPSSTAPVGDVEALAAAASATASTYQRREAGGFAHVVKTDLLPVELLFASQPEEAAQLAKDLKAKRLLFVGFRRVATGTSHTARAMASIVALDAVSGEIVWSTYITPSRDVESCLGPLTGISLRDLGGASAVKEAALKPVVEGSDDLIGSDVTMVVMDTETFADATGIRAGVQVRNVVDFDTVFSYLDPLFFSRSRFHLHHLSCVEGIASPVTAEDEARALRWLCLKYGRSVARPKMEDFVVSALRAVPQPTKEEMLLNRCDGVCLSHLQSRCSCNDGPSALRQQQKFERLAENFVQKHALQAGIVPEPEEPPSRRRHGSKSGLARGESGVNSAPWPAPPVPSVAFAASPNRGGGGGSGFYRGGTGGGGGGGGAGGAPVPASWQALQHGGHQQQHHYQHHHQHQQQQQHHHHQQPGIHLPLQPHQQHQQRHYGGDPAHQQPQQHYGRDNSATPTASGISSYQPPQVGMRGAFTASSVSDDAVPRPSLQPLPGRHAQGLTADAPSWQPPPAAAAGTGQTRAPPRPQQFRSVVSGAYAPQPQARRVAPSQTGGYGGAGAPQHGGRGGGGYRGGYGGAQRGGFHGGVHGRGGGYGGYGGSGHGGGGYGSGAHQGQLYHGEQHQGSTDHESGAALPRTVRAEVPPAPRGGGGYVPLRQPGGSHRGGGSAAGYQHHQPTPYTNHQQQDQQHQQQFPHQQQHQQQHQRHQHQQHHQQPPARPALENNTTFRTFGAPPAAIDAVTGGSGLLSFDRETPAAWAEGGDTSATPTTSGAAGAHPEVWSPYLDDR